MATITSQTTDLTRAGVFNDLKHDVLHVSDIDDGETITPGQTSIVRAAFEADSVDDDVNVTVLTPSILYFAVGATSAHSGILHIWSRGY